MKKKVKTVCQIIRFRGKIEAFLVSIDLFDIPNDFGFYVTKQDMYILYENMNNSWNYYFLNIFSTVV